LVEKGTEEDDWRYAESESIKPTSSELWIPLWERYYHGFPVCAVRRLHGENFPPSLIVLSPGE
jgi:hypothetical protein